MSRHEPIEAGADGQGWAYGDTVLERVLFAIICAHTTPETEGRERERLDMAMTALVGPAKGNRYSDALLFMARQRQRDACDLDMAVLRHRNCSEPRVRSNRELAELAAREVLGCVASRDVRTVASQLCDMFSRQRSCPVERYYVQEALETEAVKRLCDELAEWDVPTRL